MTAPRVLRSERLVLRELEERDAPFVVSLYADARVTRALSKIQSPLSVEQAVDLCRPENSPPGEHRLCAVLGDELIAVGTVRIAADLPDVATIGYSLLPAFWDQGFGTELAGLLIEFATLEGASEIRATTRDDNAASRRVLEKLRFRPVEVGVPEVDSRGDTHAVTRWTLRPGSMR